MTLNSRLVSFHIREFKLLTAAKDNSQSIISRRIHNKKLFELKLTHLFLQAPRTMSNFTEDEHFTSKPKQAHQV